MPKRNTTEEILDGLTQADRDAAEKKSAALATVPDPTWMSHIAFELTFSDRVFNVRDEASYAFDANKRLYQSLKEKGLEKRGDPMAFNLEADGRYKVLVGNLRHTMMAEIRREEIERRAKAGEPPDAATLPFATVFGLVYPNLAPGQQIAIMADHIGRKDLNEFERCKEIGEFIEANGLTDGQAETHFGMDKNKVRRYRMRWAMPTVMAEFRKEKAGKGSTESYLAIGQKQLEALYSAYMIDRKAGNAHREEGPAFRAALDKIKADPTAFKTPGPKDKGPITIGRDDLMNQVTASTAHCGNGFEIVAIADTLKYAAGEEGINLNVVRETAKREADAIRSEVSRLGTERDKLAETVLTLTSERDTLREENERLKASRKQNGGKPATR